MTGEQLDFYLSIGYFRTQQDIFTCQFLPHGNAFHAVQWLRIVLDKISYGKTQQRLMRANAKFSATVGPLVLSDELESLYAQYWNALDFDAPTSVKTCLLGNSVQNRFDTQVIEVRDGGKLIAVGVFDRGRKNIAGIMNFYHPDYRKYSLGKYLMLLKINHARIQQKIHYYPGYLVDGYPKFDYKLFPCEAATEVFDSIRGIWLPFSWATMTTLSEALINELDSQPPFAFIPDEPNLTN